MKQPIVLFGTGDIAELAQFYFDSDSAYEVAAFTVDDDYRKEDRFHGRPVVAFEQVATAYPPSQFNFFVALSYAKLNAVRKQKYLAAKALGYRLASYVSSRANVLNAGRIGDNCFILEDCTIQPFATIGNNVSVWSGCTISHHSVIGDHCFLAPRVAISGGVAVGEECFIGINATLRNHIRVGKRCVIGAGTLLLSDAEPEGVYIGAATERSHMSSTRAKSL